jgi:hypothetical protein
MHDKIFKFNALHKVDIKRRCQCESQYEHHNEHELIAGADTMFSESECHNSELCSVH